MAVASVVSKLTSHNLFRRSIDICLVIAKNISSSSTKKTQSTMQSVKLSSGYEMPIVGLGTWQAQAGEIESAVGSALDSGYRHIDTAFNYNNEEAIGKSLKQWLDNGGKREDLFITTKLPNFGNRPADVEKYLKWSLQKLGLDYVDMYLIHMPFAFVCDPTGSAPVALEDGSYALDNETDPILVWKEMEKQVGEGRARSIGLSNFNQEQIEQVWKNATIKPSNLQVELHAYHQQKQLREFCRAHNIAVTCYSPLASPGAKNHFQAKYNYRFEKYPDLLRHPEVEKIAANHKKTTAQILLRHLVQEGLIVIPKSSSPERIKINIDIFNFELSADEIAVLDALDQGPAGRIFTFLFFKGIEKHPHYPFKAELS